MSFLSNLLGGGSSPFISAQDARTLVNDGAVLIDVRSPGEFASGSIPGAQNIPLQALPARYLELDKGKVYVVFCASGNRSGQAKTFLEREGFSQVHNLGGVSRW